MNKRNVVQPMEEPEFTVFLVGDRAASVYYRGQQIRNVRSVDVATSLTTNDVVRSRISIELVGETIPVRQLDPEEAQIGTPDEQPPA